MSVLQLMREGCSYKYPPLSIARYSFIQLSELEQWREQKIVYGFTQDLNPSSLIRKSEALPLKCLVFLKQYFLHISVKCSELWRGNIWNKYYYNTAIPRFKNLLFLSNVIQRFPCPEQTLPLTSTHIERSGSGVESTKRTWVQILCCRVNPKANLFILHCSNSLSCMNEYMAIDSDGYLYGQPSRIICSMAGCFPEKPRQCSIEQVCQGSKV